MEPLLVVLLALLVFMSVLFVIAMAARNNGVADIGYGVAFMVMTATAVFLAVPSTVPVMLVALLPFIWGTRLALRIYNKNKGKPEDFRYKAWRDAWGKTFVLRSFFQIYMLQGLVAFLVVSPVVLSILYPHESVYLVGVYLGLAVWITGFVFESVGDAQLDAFISKSENKGKIMTGGLWKYTRHPNYFGESTMWVGIAIMSASITVYPWFVLISPLLITYLLLFVSGVPMLEKKWEGNAEWEVYKKRTSVFIPLPPKKI